MLESSITILKHYTKMHRYKNPSQLHTHSLTIHRTTTEELFRKQLMLIIKKMCVHKDRQIMEPSWQFADNTT